jgi:hypothetical protein
LLVGPDPEPCDDFAFTEPDCAIVISDSNDADSVAPFFKLERSVIRIEFPKCVFFAGELLHRRWQHVKAFPETPVRLPVTADP